MVFLAVLAGSLVKTVTGQGLPIIAVPLIALAMSVEDAVAVVALPGAIANLTICLTERAARDRTRDLPVMVVLGLVGSAVGTLALVSLPSAPFQIALAVAVLVYVTLAATHREFQLSTTAGHRGAPWIGLLGGVAQGTTGVAGPVYGSWILAYRLDRRAYVFSVTLLFLAVGVGQLVTLLGTGAMAGRWAGVAVALPAALGVIPFGTRVRERLSGERFEQVVLVVLVASAAAILLRLAF